MNDQTPVLEEPAFFEQTWDLSYRHALGKTVGGFLNGLKSKRLLARVCPDCGRRLFPARSFCDRCHASTEGWSEVELAGTLEMYTIVYEEFPGMHVKPPYVLAYVLLDGADTAHVGYLRGIDLADVTSATASIRSGDRVAVEFAEEPEGVMTDFWFVPEGGRSA